MTIFSLRGVYLALCLVPALLAGCQKYSVSLNDRVIYTPPGLFSDYALADAQLAQCMLQTIVDLNATSITQVTRLNCSNAGIKSIAGLEKFYALTQLKLTDNDIEDISPLAQLARLEYLNLDENPVRDPSPLLSLVNLKQLHFNPAANVDCGALAQVKQTLSGQVNAQWPQQCP